MLGFPPFRGTSVLGITCSSLPRPVWEASSGKGHLRPRVSQQSCVFSYDEVPCYLLAKGEQLSPGLEMAQGHILDPWGVSLDLCLLCLTARCCQVEES